MVIGDGAGNCRIFAPLRMAALLAGVAALLMLLGKRGAGTAIALIALSMAATVPVHRLLNPPPSATSLTRFPDDGMVTLEGYLVRAPERVEGERDQLYLYLKAERAGVLDGSMGPAQGMIRITIANDFHFLIGDELRVTSRLRFPRIDGNPGEFDYRSWLMRQGIMATMFVAPTKRIPQPYKLIGHRYFPIGLAIQAAREHIARFIDAHLDYPQNVELRALIIGDRGGIGEGLRNEFALTGMAHLLVISGLHLGFVAATAFFLVRLIIGFGAPSLMIRGYANKLAAGGAALAVFAYAMIAGHRVSTMRALVMVLSYAIAVALDRSRELVSSLALAALVLIIALPGSTADIGFQLSFASVLVILLGMRRFTAWWRWQYMNPLAPYVERTRLNVVSEVVAGYVAVSFWALVGTAPLTAFHFNQFSIIGLVANAVVVPIMGFGSVTFGLVASALSFFSEPIAAPLLWVAGRLAAVGTALAGWFMDWPLAWHRIFTPTPIELVFAYGLILVWITAPLVGEVVRMQLRRPNRIGTSAVRPQFSRWRELAVASLGLALVIDTTYWLQQRYFCSHLRITFLSVGEGDGAVIRFPGSRVMLIDGGGAFRSTFDPGERIVAPFLWSQKIMHVDYILVSHPDRDHFGGLIFIARNFTPSQFWTSGIDSPAVSYNQLVEAINQAGARTSVCNSATPPITIAGVALRCPGPLANLTEIKENNSSMVVRISYGANSILFPGDLEAKGEHELIASGANLRATVLKVPHHGSHTSSSARFIEAVDPAVAVISLGYRNRFHFPAEEVIARYRDADVRVLRTDQDGAISLDASPDSLRLWSYHDGEVRLPGFRR